MLVDDIRNMRVAARKSHDIATLSILTVVMGEIEPIESREGKPLDDARVQTIIRKLIQSNTDTAKQLTDAGKIQSLSEEIIVLSKLIPENASYDETEAELLNSDGPEVEQIQGAKSEGQGIGIAMKFFKAHSGTAFGKPVDSRVVAEVVKKFRSMA